MLLGRRTLTCCLVLLLLGAGASTAVSSQHETSKTRLIVDIDGSLAVPLEEALAATGGERLRTDERLGIAVVRGPEDPLRALLGDAVGVDGSLTADTKHAGEDSSPNDPRWEDQWALPYLDIEQAWEIQPGRENVTVAIVDTGVDVDHEDLRSVPTRLGRDYVDPGTQPIDETGHGTHVAGIVAATRDNGRGVVGTANVSLYVSRVLGTGEGSCSSAASGIADAAENGSEVINLSLYCSRPGPLERAAAYAASQGALVVSTAGNAWASGNPVGIVNCQTAISPSFAPTVVTVGAMAANRDPASFSCRHPHVDVAAPGESVLSTLPDDEYGRFDGTSMAAPQVSGTAALLFSHRPNLTPEEVHGLLVETADPQGTAPWSQAFGFGIVDPVEALERAEESPDR